MAASNVEVHEKKEVERRTESTKEAPLFVPRVDIFEDQDALTLLVDMPGVSSDGVNINLENNQLTVYGKTHPVEPAGSPVYSEYRVGDYTRSFTLSTEIEQSGIEAAMKNGVLRLRLPKAESLKPKKIEVQTG